MTLREWIFLAGIASHRPQQYVIVTLLTFFCFLTLTSKQKYLLMDNTLLSHKRVLKCQFVPNEYWKQNVHCFHKVYFALDVLTERENFSTYKSFWLLLHLLIIVSLCK